MTCPACSATAPDGSRFCPFCGRPLGTSGVVVTADEQTVVADALFGATVTHVPDRGTSKSGGSAPLTLEPGTLFGGRYRITRLLGRGGMGVVYHAQDVRLGHEVALKFLPPALANDRRRLEQFHNEVSVARQISHPNVCRVYDIGDLDGQLFLSMEYVEGEDLGAALARGGGFPENQAVELTRQICAGLTAVHARGVLHRDLKPANIMITAAGDAKLMDFGIASAGGDTEAERVTEGTPAYMAPEQLTRREVSVRSDLYALGLVMYELFTGRRALQGATLEELTHAQPSLPSSVSPDLTAVSPKVREAILACLDVEPANRPGSASAVAGMLQLVLLDAEATWRRIAQVVAQATFLPFLILGLTLALRGGTAALIGSGLMAASLALVLHELRFPLGWTVSYKGHRIIFRNHPVWGERLYIDGVLADRGRFGLNVTLRGTIEAGDGAGERITASVRAALQRLACRIVVESFAATPRAAR